jgi:D-alanyl-D-alanine dipeptidase
MADVSSDESNLMSIPDNDAAIEMLDSTDEHFLHDHTDKKVHDTDFVDLSSYKSTFAYDMRYADTNNFLKEKVYECPTCYLRKAVVEALIQVNDSLFNLGFRIKLFDCYRPKSVQLKMWDIFPDGRYVANPHKNGSVHNRGGAVDITLETLEGVELDMGTGFDHFGKEAHSDYMQHSDTVLANRAFLKNSMENYGFSGIRTEWWHYNFGSAKSYGLSNFPIHCE